MRSALIVVGSGLSWSTVVTVAVLQWTGRWRSWATRGDAPSYDLVNAVFGISPLPPLILAANIVLVLVGFGVSATLRFDRVRARAPAVALYALMALVDHLVAPHERTGSASWLARRHRPSRPAQSTSRLTHSTPARGPRRGRRRGAAAARRAEGGSVARSQLEADA